MQEILSHNVRTFKAKDGTLIHIIKGDGGFAKIKVKDGKGIEFKLLNKKAIREAEKEIGIKFSADE